MEYKLRISIGDLQVELCGSEAFIKKYEEKFTLAGKFQKLSIKTSGNPLDTSQQDNASTKIPADKSPTGKSPTDNAYPHVFDLSGKKTKLIIRPSKLSKSKAKKQIEVALLYLLGESIRGVGRVSYTALRPLCAEYKCSGSNFASTFSRHKHWFSITGGKSSSKKIAKLSYAGKKQAQALAGKLNKEGKR